MTTCSKCGIDFRGDGYSKCQGCRTCDMDEFYLDQGAFMQLNEQKDRERVELKDYDDTWKEEIEDDM